MEENDAIMFSKDSDISFDSLPYVDSYEGMEDKIKELIELEMKNFTPVNYLEKYPPISLKFDIQQKIEPIDITRYKVNPPPPNKKNDIQSWKQSLQNAYSQLEHQNLRIENLELLITYGINAWREYNKYLESIQKKLQELLENLKKEIENINLQRKNEQINCNSTLQLLQSKFYHLVNKNIEIERVCLNIEKEIQLLKSEQK